MKSKRIILAAITIITLAIGAFILQDIYTYRNHIDAFSGATPQALTKKVPSHMAIRVDGLVKQDYRFSNRALGLLAKTRIRTPEITPEGDIMGAYIYTGIPIIHILEGVVPQKEEGAAFDRPLDMLVEFTSTSGKKSIFSYGELIVCDDSRPVILAYNREEVLPTKSPEKYTRNKYKENLTGLRLVCPGDDDTARFLDNVERITLTLPLIPDTLLPPMEKGKECVASSITCISGDKQWALNLDEIPKIEISGWFRIGHGRGIKGDKKAEAMGYPMTTLLKENFPDAGSNDHFLFVGCDGYRSLFSARELFYTAPGRAAILMTELNGKPVHGGLTVGAVGDFFVDRCVRVVTHIAHIRN